MILRVTCKARGILDICGGNIRYTPWPHDFGWRGGGEHHFNINTNWGAHCLKRLDGDGWSKMGRYQSIRRSGNKLLRAFGFQIECYWIGAGGHQSTHCCSRYFDCSVLISKRKLREWSRWTQIRVNIRRGRFSCSVLISNRELP